MREYLTPEDFIRAEKNGIPSERAKYRFYSKLWSKERAVTQPYKPIKRVWKQYEAISKVSMNTFYQRVHAGWTHEEAASTPKLPIGHKLHPKKPIAPEIRELAKQNGIKPGTLRQRIYGYKWSPEDAATIPVGTKRPNRRKKGWR